MESKVYFGIGIDVKSSKGCSESCLKGEECRGSNDCVMYGEKVYHIIGISNYDDYRDIGFLKKVSLIRNLIKFKLKRIENDTKYRILEILN